MIFLFFECLIILLLFFNTQIQMNTFSQSINKKEQKLIDRVRIKSKLYGEYEPDLYIISRSKSRSKSISKNKLQAQVTGLETKRKYKNLIKSCEQINLQDPSHMPQFCNPQMKNFVKIQDQSNNLSQYLQARNKSNKLKRQKPAIERIFQWIQRRYFANIMNKLVDTSVPIKTGPIQQQTQLAINYQQKHQELQKNNFNKMIYDLYILHSLKNKDMFTKNPKLKKVHHSDQKHIPKPQISSKKDRQISTMNSLQALDFNPHQEKNNNTKNPKNFIQSQKEISKKQAFSQQNLKNSIFQNHENLQKLYQIEYLQSQDINIPNHVTLKLNKKLNNLTSLCDQDFSVNRIFYSQKKSLSYLPISKNQIFNDIQQTQQIIREILEINDCQSSILKNIENEDQYNIKTLQQERVQKYYSSNYQNSQKILKNALSISQKLNKITPAQNYFSQHFHQDKNRNPEARTFLMPLIRSETQQKMKNIQQKSRFYMDPSNFQKKQKSLTNNQKKTQVFTFNYLNLESKQKSSKEPNQYFVQRLGQVRNAFVKNCDIFNMCKTTNDIKDYDRSNYMTDASNIRERETSCNSNRSKTSSKPKVNFKYVSPLIKTNQKKTQIQKLNYQLQNFATKEVQKRNMLGLNQNKQNLPINFEKQVFKRMNFVTQNNDLEKQRSFSLKHYNLVKNTNKIKQHQIYRQTKVRQQNQPSKVQNLNKNFENSSINLTYYKSETNLNKNQKDNKILEKNYKNIESYYFLVNKQNSGLPIEQNYFDIGSSVNKIIQKQKQQERKLGKKNQFLARNDHRYLYPLTNSIEKNRLERTKSMNERIQVTFKKYH